MQRAWWPDPIQAVDHPYLSCNRGNPLASRNPTLHAPVEAGTNITVNYEAPLCPKGYNQPTEPSVKWPGEPLGPIRCFHGRTQEQNTGWPYAYSWPHGLGPLMVYLAPCNGPCEDFNPTGDDVVWFKINENGFHPEDIPLYPMNPPNIGVSSAWDQSPWLLGDDRDPVRTYWSVKIPENLKPGNYLIRHEIIMIELMPPQFYPECAQITVSGKGDKLPGEEYLVSFPGAYSMDGESNDY